MAKYTFKCDKCNKTQQLYVGSSDFEVKCECGLTMKRMMPVITAPTSYEDPDGQSGRKWLDDHDSILKSRKEHYYWSVEVPRFVASGVYSIETMLDNGWISLSDDGKIIINTKPPSQR